jgi:energy-coupling factor transporter ATP-binding protein EcfA2
VEAAIQESLETLMQGKTVIAIAHRLSTIARMDRLVVLEDGHIAESGTHAELLAHQGLVRATVGSPDRWVCRGGRFPSGAAVVVVADLLAVMKPEWPPPASRTATEVCRQPQKVGII